MSKHLRFLLLSSVASLAACSASQDSESVGSMAQGLDGGGSSDASAPPPADGGGVVVDASPPPKDGGGSADSGSADAGPAGLDLRKSFAVTDQALLTGFTFQRVMDQITSQAGTATTSLGLYQQWWDTQHRGINGVTSGPHCDDATTGGVASHNGFQWQCPRNEGDLTSTNPFDPNGGAFVFPIGLFNRFDLAPANGANCGEHRIVFGNTRSRNLIIFEAVLPNPNPSCGINACRPVAQFWANLSSATMTQAEARRRLEEFYFKGLPGFEPVVHVNHYGAVGGQVRSNQFQSGGAAQQLWMLREFHLGKICSPNGACTLGAVPVTVKTNPGTQLFSDATNDPRKAKFQATLVEQVKSLAVNDINGFGMSIPDGFNSGQSQSQSFDTNLTSPTLTNDYAQVFNPQGVLAGAIQQRLTAIGSTLTPRDIVERATTQSCGGCHNFSGFRNLGGGLTWPPAAGFVHVQEFGSEQGGFGPGFPISQALKNVFLPRRREVMQAFLARRRTFCPVPLDPVAIPAVIVTQDELAKPAEPSVETLGGTRSVH